METDGSIHSDPLGRFGRAGYPCRNGPGFTVVELAVATAMVAMFLVLVGEMIVFARTAQRALQRQVAIDQTADNLLEQITGLPWDTLQPGTDFTRHLPEPCIAGLAGMTWDVDVAHELQPVPAKRITVRVTRPARDGRANPTVRMTTWIYQLAGARAGEEPDERPAGDTP